MTNRVGWGMINNSKIGLPGPDPGGGGLYEPKYGWLWTVVSVSC